MGEAPINRMCMLGQKPIPQVDREDATVEYTTLGTG